MKQSSYEIDMLNGPLGPKILRFAVPLMASSMLQLMFNAADVIVVGKYAGDASLAAVTSTGALVNLLVNLFTGCSVGANVVAAQAIGHGDSARISKAVHTSILLALLGGVFLTVFGGIAAPRLLRLMSSPDSVIGLSSLYLRIYFLGMPGMLCYNFGAALLRAGGDTQQPLNCLSIAGGVNVLLNLVLVIVFHLGVAGVAIATAISQYVSATLVLRCLMRETGSLHLIWKELGFDRDALWNIVRVGLPAGFQGIVFSLSNVVIQSSINSFGPTVMSGAGASGNIEGFVYVAMNAFHQSCLTFVSQNYGAGKCKRCDKSLLWCQGYVVAAGLLLGGLATLLGPWLLGIYTDNPEVITQGMIRLRLVSLTYFLCGIMDVMAGGLRGLGRSVTPMIVSMLGACGLRLLWIATVFSAHRTPWTLYVSYPISWTITALAQLVCFLSIRKRAYAQVATGEAA